MEIGKKLISPASWDVVFETGPFQKDLEEIILPEYIQTCRWFAGKSSTIKHVRINHILSLTEKKKHYYIIIIEAQFREAFSQFYLIPLAYVPHPEDNQYTSSPIIAPVRLGEVEGSLYDALFIPSFRELLFDHLVKEKANSIR
jgi:maltose alpha-D-glucosyltransferase/alpha-amylase